MRKEILTTIKDYLEKFLNKKVQLLEPDWTKPQTFPAVWLELGTEKLDSGVNVSYRNIPFSIYIADRNLYNSAKTSYENILDLADTIEENLDNYSSTILDKKVVINYKGFESFIEQFVNNTKSFLVIAVRIDFFLRIRR